MMHGDDVGRPSAETELDGVCVVRANITTRRGNYCSHTFFTAAHDCSLKPTGHYMYHQLNIHKFHVLPTQLYLCVLCGSQNKQRLFPYTALTDLFL